MNTSIKRRPAAASVIAVVMALPHIANATAVVDANGTFVGAYVGELTPLVRPGGDPELLRRSEIVTTTGYRTVVDLGTGAVRSVFRVYYQSSDCSGQGYVQFVGPNTFGEAPFRGYVFGSADSPSVDPVALFYVAKDAQIDTSGAFAFGSVRLADGICSVGNGFHDTSMIEVLDNDPGVTGFDPAGLLPPFDVVIITDLFYDGFEAASRSSVERQMVSQSPRVKRFETAVA